MEKIKTSKSALSFQEKLNKKRWKFYHCKMKNRCKRISIMESVKISFESILIFQHFIFSNAWWRTFTLNRLGYFKIHFKKTFESARFFLGAKIRTLFLLLTKFELLLSERDVRKMTKNHDENREIFLISRHVVYVAFSKKYPAALLSSFIKEWMQADYGRLVREGYDRF